MKWYEDIWLGSILGKPSYYLDSDYLSKVEIPELITYTPTFFSAKVNTASILLSNELERNKFRLVDTNLTLKMANPKIKVKNMARLAIPDDEDRVRHIAGNSLRMSRFHNDSEIDEVIADNIKKKWVENYFTGARGDWMIISERDNKIAGFLLGLQMENKVIIDLLAVDKSFRNQGCGSEMIQYLAQQCNKDEKDIIVGTQIANTVSIQFYQSIGFKFDSSAYVFHKHI